MDIPLNHPLHEASYPVQARVEPAQGERNRLTVGFRLLLGIPHLLLVGGPIAAPLSWSWSSQEGVRGESGGGGGALGVVAGVAAVISWFTILFTGRHPQGLWTLCEFYLRWRMRALTYLALLRDEYPPFGEGPYPADILTAMPDGPRDRLSVAFRLILGLPHLLAVWALSVAWMLATIIAWFSILLTGRHPESLYDFGAGVLRWSMRVEAYLLLLRDEYPPFSLE